MAHEPVFETAKYTHFGRNRHAIKRISDFYAMRSEPITAWMVGLGYEDGSTAEHLELANALHRARANFVVRAMDVASNPVRRARETLLENRVVIPLKDWGTGLRGYIEHFGYEHVDQDHVALALPAEVRSRIKVLGPDDEGNIFKSMPRERPDVITCFNWLDNYEGKRRGKMLFTPQNGNDALSVLKTIVRALKPGGLLAIDSTSAANFRGFLIAHLVEFPWDRMAHSTVYMKPIKLPAKQRR